MRTRTRALDTQSSLAVAPLLALLLLGLLPSAVSAAAVTRYVDCVAGNDANTGLLTSAAWKSLSKVNSASLAPGDKLLLKRGCSWTGPLNAKWIGTALLPITIGAYGAGELPKIQNAKDNVVISGDYQIVENLHTRANPVGYDAGCENWPMGWRVGFRLYASADHNIIRSSLATELYFGVLVGAGSHHNKILSNVFRDIKYKDTDPNSDAGTVAVAIHGDDNEVAYNDISGADSCSYFFSGRDGAAVDIYGGQRNTVHHNRARENNAFAELGNSRAADNTYAYNYVTSSLKIANFLVTRGASNVHGPVYRTKAYNNTAYLWGAESFGLQCYGGCSPSILSLRNNVLWVQDRIGYADAAFDEGNNIYWNTSGAPKLWFPISSSSRKIDPKFVNRGALDLHLTSTSPAIDKATTAAFNLGYKTDLDSIPVPQGAAPDIGTYEFGSPSFESRADLALLSRVDANGSVVVGSHLVYTTTLENRGPDPAWTAVIRQTIPTTASFLGASAGCVHSGGQLYGGRTVGGTVTCSIAALSNGALVAKVIVVGPVAASALAATITAGSATADSVGANNSVAVAVSSVYSSGQVSRCTRLGTSGFDTLVGTSGNDVLCSFGGNDLLEGRGGNDVLNGGPGTDRARYGTAKAGVNIDLSRGTTACYPSSAVCATGSDRLVSVEDASGGPYRDRIVGSGGPNKLWGLAGSDLLYGSGGNDRLYGGIGSDLARGQYGDDVLYGEDGADHLYGDAGNDYLSGGAGPDACSQGAGSGTLTGC
jgi:uncharacterized repeat protein (TIGR01451 family)